MASEVLITPFEIDFHPSFPDPTAKQTVAFKVAVLHGWVRIRVATPSAGVFAWDAVDDTLMPAQGLRHIPVSFHPTSAAPIETAVMIDIQELSTGGSLPGFPRPLVVKGNAPGVGPGALSVVSIAGDPDGVDPSAEVVSITNVTSQPLSLAGCSFGDMGARERQLLPSGLFTTAFRTGPVLQPFATSGETLRIFTGAGPAQPTPPHKNIALRLREPLWTGSGDTAWIRNEYGQLIEYYTYRRHDTAGPLYGAGFSHAAR